MRQRILTLLLVLFSLCLWTMGASARIYKHVDKDGNITYTDIPTSTSDKAVKENPMTTFKPVATPKVDTSSSEKSKKSSDASTYDAIQITSPEDNAIIRANSGTITVQVLSHPGLNVSAGDKYVILVDGDSKPPSQSNSISVSDLARGQHSMSVQIQDKDDNVLISSNPVQINILRTSVHKPNPRAR